MAVIGCDYPVSVIGADKLATTTGVWVKTLFRVDGPYLCATTYLVAAGEPRVFELKIDLRPLEAVARKVHERLHARKSAVAAAQGQPVVGFSVASAWRDIKKTTKKIGKNKLVKAVGKGVKAVIDSKVTGAVLTGVAVAVPAIGVPVLAAYGAAKVASSAIDKGRKLIQGANQAKNTLSAAKNAVSNAASTKVNAAGAAKAAVSKAAAAKATATKAAGIQAALINVAKNAPTIAARAQAAAKAQTAGKAKNAATAAIQKNVTLAKNLATQAKGAASAATPLLARAAALQKTLSDPAVKAKLMTVKKQAESAQKLVQSIKHKQLFGSPAEKLEAQKSAAIMNITMRNEARLKAIADLNAGGLPAMLIDRQGRILPGRYRIDAKAPGKNPDVLYTGPGKYTQTGRFTRISGVIAGANPPPRPSVRQTRGSVIDEWIQRQRSKGALRSRVSGTPGDLDFGEDWQAVVGACGPVPAHMVQKLQRAMTPSIGCDCEGTQF